LKINIVGDLNKFSNEHNGVVVQLQEFARMTLKSPRT